MKNLDVRALQGRIDRGFGPLVQNLKTRYGFDRLSPFAFHEFERFALRRGNRVRSVLLLLSYLGYSGKPVTARLCTWASSLELIQNFILIHDDIIDAANLRRGGPSLHIGLNHKLARKKSDKAGRDIAMILGDMFFAAGIDLFMSLCETPQKKQRALAELMQAAVATGCGEISELLLDVADIGGVTKSDIFKTYDLKTARYTFITPLLLGAILGGAPAADRRTLSRIGLLCGRAFQIRDDITELLSSNIEAQKTFLADFKASKKTILLWYFLQRAGDRDRRLCTGIFLQKRKTTAQLKKIKELFIANKVTADAEAEIRQMVRSAVQLAQNLSASPAAKACLRQLIESIATTGKQE